MPRKGHIAKRDVLPDPIYNNKVVTKLINNIMLDGKKGVAQKIVYGAFDRIAEETGKDALEVFTEAMNNIMPALEVKARRASCKRTYGCSEQHWCICKEKRRYAQNGRSKQSFRTLQILISYLHRMCCIGYAAVRIHFIGGKNLGWKRIST